MGLQIRLRHALGERVLDLPERPADSPIVVGRETTADLRIPSFSVAEKQLVLFVHDGRWLAQHAAGTAGSLLNGEPITGAKTLANGDVLTLSGGADSAVIEIESVGAVAQVVRQPPSAPPPVEVEPAYESQEEISEPPPSPVIVATDVETDWMVPASPSIASSRRVKKRRWADALIAFAMLAVIGTVAGTAAYVYTHRLVAKPAPVAVAPTTKPKREARPEQPSSKPTLRTVFTEQPVTAAAPTLPDITDETPPTTAKSVATTQALKIFPEAPDAEAVKAFKVVESAYYSPDPAKALLAFDAYAKTNPGMNVTLLEKYRADMLDKIWWERIDSLFKKRDELSAAVKKTEQDIKDETEAAYKKTVLQPRLADQKKRIEALTARLTKDMAYISAKPPPIGSDADMYDLRSRRDAKVYGDWCKRVSAYILSHQGAYPWANEK